MNDQEVVAHMTEYIRELEQTALRNKLISGTPVSYTHLTLPTIA